MTPRTPQWLQDLSSLSLSLFSLLSFLFSLLSPLSSLIPRCGAKVEHHLTTAWSCPRRVRNFVENLILSLLSSLFSLVSLFSSLFSVLSPLSSLISRCGAKAE